MSQASHGIRAAEAGAITLLIMAGYGPAQGYQTIIENGPSANRVDIVFLGDGYKPDELGTSYPRHIEAMLDHLFNDGEDPYPRYRNFFNVHRIDVVSKQSGADVPPRGIFRDTALDARYYADGATSRLLYIDESKAEAALKRGLAGAPFNAEMKLVTVNDSRYGGGGGAFAAYAGGNLRATEVALHEIGHAFHGLGDEYGGIRQTYAGSEPAAANIARRSPRSGSHPSELLSAAPPDVKWSHWLGYDQPGVGVIGAYEGAGLYDQGLLRPSPASKMRSLGQPFDAVAREKIILDLYELVDPLDGWTDNAAVLMDPVLRVQSIDPQVIRIEWTLDGQAMPGIFGESFDPVGLGIAAGAHQVVARAFDPTDWVRAGRDQLEQSVGWKIVLVPEPASAAAAGLAALLLGRRRNRGAIADSRAMIDDCLA